jgi:hypothetical protein
MGKGKEIWGQGLVRSRQGGTKSVWHLSIGFWILAPDYLMPE